MTEGPPKMPPIEKKEKEPISKEQVIERLKANPQDLSPKIEYMERREDEVVTDEERTLLIIEMGDIEKAAGRLQVAGESFQRAAYDAEKLHQATLHQTAVERLKEMGMEYDPTWIDREEY